MKAPPPTYHRFLYLIGCLLLLLQSCTKTPDKIENLNNGQIESIGHGGPGTQPFYDYVPHNSKRGLLRGLHRTQLDGVEMDVQMSADGKLILFHDNKLNNKTNCKGQVFEYSMSELLQCKYEHPIYNMAPGNNPLVPLEEMLLEIKRLKPNGIFVLDLKLQPIGDEEKYQEDFANELVRIIHSTATKKNTCIESMNPRMLERIQELDSTLHLFLYVVDFTNGIKIATENKFYGLTVKYNLVNQSDIKKAHSQGLRVSLWGPRTKSANTKAICLQPDYIQTDKLDDLIQKVAKYE